MDSKSLRALQEARQALQEKSISTPRVPVVESAMTTDDLFSMYITDIAEDISRTRRVTMESALAFVFDCIDEGMDGMPAAPLVENEEDTIHWLGEARLHAFATRVLRLAEEAEVG